MKEIKLSQTGKNKILNLVALVDDSDYDWLSKFNWHALKSSGTYYAARSPDKKKMHRLILGLTDPKIPCDHIDHNGLNNQRNNIRVCTQSQNLCNKSARKNGSSKYLGVCWDKQYNKWKVGIRENKRLKFIGLFHSETDAALAYNNAAKEVHGEFANLNLIQ